MKYQFELPKGIPEDIDEWNKNIIDIICENEIQENQHLEYKEKFVSTEKIEKEILGMTNAYGGVIVFGIKDNLEIHPLKHEKEKDQMIQQSISHNRNVHTKLEYISFVEKDNTKRGFYVLFVKEALKKPVSASNGAIWKRIQSHVTPMDRESIKRTILTEEPLQTALSRLELEIDEFYKVFNESFNEHYEYIDNPKKYSCNMADIERLNPIKFLETIKDARLHEYGYKDKVSKLQEHLLNIDLYIKKINNSEEYKYNSSEKESISCFAYNIDIEMKRICEIIGELVYELSLNTSKDNPVEK